MIGRAGRALSAALAVALAAFSGCCATTPPAEPAPPPIPDTPPPAYSQIVARYNSRVARLERLWTPIAVRLRGTNDRGETFDETTEGYLQFVRPRNVSLSILKIGEEYFRLGSNPTEFWWFDMTSDHSVALRGTHERADPAAIRRFGLPVHPLDLVELLGITPLDPQARAEVAWADGRTIRVMMPGRSGPRRLLLDATNFEPREAAVIGPGGVPSITASLSEYVTAEVLDQRAARPRLASLVEVRFAGNDLVCRLQLTQPENREINPVNFDYAGLKARFRIKSEVSLDARPRPDQPRPAPAGPVPATTPGAR